MSAIWPPGLTLPAVASHFAYIKIIFEKNLLIFTLETETSQPSGKQLISFGTAWAAWQMILHRWLSLMSVEEPAPEKISKLRHPH